MENDEVCWLREGERFDDLQRNRLKIIQKTDGFRFGMDAVLLSGFAKVKPGECAMDLCCGNGIIPLLLSAKTGGRHFYGLELLPENVEMARRSVAFNGLEDRITIEEGDVREAAKHFGTASFDVVTCNPPYMKSGHGLQSEGDLRLAARHEVFLTLPEAVEQAAALLRPKGRVYFVHRPFRLTELVVCMHESGVEAKRMRLVYPYADREPNMVLVEGIRGGRPYLNVDPPLVVYEETDKYTREILETYGY